MNGMYGFNPNINGYGCCSDINLGEFKQFLSRLQTFMPYDLDESENYYYVTMALPGFEASDIDVSVKGNEILIETKKVPDLPELDNEESLNKEPRVKMNEFVWMRKIEVKIPVDNEIDTDSVKAKLTKGVLRLRFKKMPKKKVEVEE